MDKKKVIIGVCTYKRPKTLDYLLTQLNFLELPLNTVVEIIVVDNCSDFPAKNVVEEQSKNHSLKIHYYSEPKQGIAFVRNKILKESLILNADYIAFIDDDEYPDKNWLFSSYKTLNDFSADVVTGKVIPDFNNDDTPTRIKENYLFKPKNKRKTGEERNFACTGNVLFTTDIMKKSNSYFDESYGLMTGEDIDFFGRAKKEGYKIIWDNDSIVYETVSDDRKSLKFLLKRNFNNGFLKVFNKRKENKGTSAFFTAVLNIFIFAFLLLPSIVLGLTSLYNCLGQLWFNLGALSAVFNKKSLDYYGRS